MKNQNEFATISAGTYSSPLQSTQTESHRVLISSLFVTTQFIYCIDFFRYNPIVLVQIKG